MSNELRQLLGMRRNALQSRIDAMGQSEAKLIRRLTEFRSQGDGLRTGTDDRSLFYYAARAGSSAREAIRTLEHELVDLRAQTRALVKERLSLDIAEKKLIDQMKAERRLEQSRADLKQ